MTPTPERIHGWQSTQLSIARHYGCIRLQGQLYHVANNEPGQPLVRADVLTREAAARQLIRRECRAQQRQLAEQERAKQAELAP